MAEVVIDIAVGMGLPPLAASHFNLSMVFTSTAWSAKLVPWPPARLWNSISAAISYNGAEHNTILTVDVRELTVNATPAGPHAAPELLLRSGTVLPILYPSINGFPEHEARDDSLRTHLNMEEDGRLGVERVDDAEYPLPCICSPLPLPPEEDFSRILEGTWDVEIKDAAESDYWNTETGNYPHVGLTNKRPHASTNSPCSLEAFTHESIPRTGRLLKTYVDVIEVGDHVSQQRREPSTEEFLDYTEGYDSAVSTYKTLQGAIDDLDIRQFTEGNVATVMTGSLAPSSRNASPNAASPNAEDMSPMVPETELASSEPTTPDGEDAELIAQLEAIRGRRIDFMMQQMQHEIEETARRWSVEGDVARLEEDNNSGDHNQSAMDELLQLVDELTREWTAASPDGEKPGYSTDISSQYTGRFGGSLPTSTDTVTMQARYSLGSPDNDGRKAGPGGDLGCLVDAIKAGRRRRDAAALALYL
ncbi:hypothetical protein EVJ58_g3904 [Rhodofomes roseus]|uniref:Uncharacterized protein n=1 Tax=Rhodofomes roseus TaxID=34475 RepID=A0A4Y9YMZ5_9APHY|nr:hypothetical protein EVJ58_g3904 [Rhodofomes roseus]